MNSSATGGSAFPSKRRVMRAGYPTDDFEPIDGMTLRDYFAAKAMQAHMVGRGEFADSNKRTVAECAYDMADALLEARNKPWARSNN